MPDIATPRVPLLLKAPIVVGIVFVALKSAGVLSWPWWIATSPLWGFVVLNVLICAWAGYMFGRKVKKAGGAEAALRQMLAKAVANREKAEATTGSPNALVGNGVYRNRAGRVTKWAHAGQTDGHSCP